MPSAAAASRPRSERARFEDYRELLGKVDAVTIAATTAEHFALARFFLEHGVHVLVEKPMTRTSAEAAILTKLAEERKLKLQVGHVERFNPALLAARESLTTVRFIECHRLAPFKGRGADVNVILDVMIHDLDVILSLVDSKPSKVSAVGIPVLMDDIDIANARIEFANGAIANVTASRVSTTPQRRFRVFQPNQYVSIDFGNGEVRRITKHGEWREGETPLREETWNLEKGDALLAETKAFVDGDRRGPALRRVRRGRLGIARARRDDRRRHRPPPLTAFGRPHTPPEPAVARRRTRSKRGLRGRAL